MSETQAFAGFPEAAFDFYDGLEENNSREFWDANKGVFDGSIRAPMQALLDSLPAKYQPFKVFRPHRDVRFSRDKSPYKLMYGAASETRGGVGHYLQVSSAGVLVAVGMWSMARDQLGRYRAAVADPRSGPKLERVIDDLRTPVIEVGSGMDEPLRTAPRGWPKDHPRIELLRWKGCTASTQISSELVHSAQVRTRLLDVWKRSEPLARWLEDRVGPSDEPDAR